MFARAVLDSSDSEFSLRTVDLLNHAHKNTHNGHKRKHAWDGAGDHWAGRSPGTW